MFICNRFFSTSRSMAACLIVCFVAGCFVVLNASAGTLTITDDNGQKAPLEIQANDYIRVTTASDGDVFLVLKGFSITIDDGAGTGSSGTDSGSSSTDSSASGGGSGGSGGDTGSSSGDSSSSGGGSGSSGGDTGSSSGSTGNSGGTGIEVVTDGYCSGNDPSAADCQVDQNFDPWIAGTGETPYWIRSRLTEVFPFTLPARSTASDTRYGYLQLTTGERKRDAVQDDIFHMWFSETPNGPVLQGNKCEWYGEQAKTYFYWTQDPSLAGEMCDLGTASRTLYVNFETRCYEPLYSGSCSDASKQKSSVKYQFDVSRRIKGY